MKVGYLGPKGTFSFEACKLYTDSESIIEFNTITETFYGLKNGIVDEIIVPIENSLNGGVTETIDCLLELNDIYVKSEIIIEIRQNLMSKGKYKLEELKELYSHPQALAQCRNFINTNLKNLTINKVSSTALAAKEIKDKEYAACIANLSCIKEYGLELLNENIQDNDFNKTRFWVLSKNKNQNGKKTSLIFSTKNKPGALYTILGIFNKHNINLSKIESRPAKTVLGEYNFLVDIDVNENIETCLNEIKNECRELKFLGLYEVRV